MDSYSIVNANVVVPKRTRNETSIAVEEGRIAGFSKNERAKIDLGGDCYVYPALINVHDHLRGDYLPRVGPKPGKYYVNWSYWDNDLKSSKVYEERAPITVEQMYYLGAYKNLFSGVATVNDHFPHEINEAYIPRLPIRVITEYCLAHECSSFDLKWGEGIEIEHKWATERDWPFITHLAEGFDAESQDGIGVLERVKCLDERDVFIHCIGFSDDDIKKTAKAGASVAWCPGSNTFMFNVTCKVRKMLKAGINVAIGTDSTHTGCVNLLEEMKFAREIYRSMYGEDLPAKTLYEMTTINAAKAFRMSDRIGSLETGKYADMLVTKAKLDDPYENLANLKMKDIVMLFIEGKPVYIDEKYADYFGRETTGYGKITLGKRRMLVAGDPLGLYKGVRKTVGFKKKLGYLPFEE